MAAGTFTLAAAQAGTEAMLGWVEIHHFDDTGAAHVSRWSWIDLDDPITYYGGFKPARVLACSWTRGSTSPLEQGQWVTATLTVTLSDVDQVFRRQFGNDYQAKLRGAEIALFLITRSDWQAKNDPSVTWRGVVDRIAPAANWQVQIDAVDILTPMLDRTYPETVIDSTVHAGCVDDVLGMTEPMIFGVMGADHPLYGGSVPVILEGVLSTVGPDPTCRRLIVSRGAMTIDSVWLTPNDAGPGGQVDVTSTLGNTNGIYAPGYADWNTTPAGGAGHDYLDLGGRRFTVIYVNNLNWAKLAEDKTHVLTVACHPTTYSGYNRPANHLAQILDNVVFKSSATVDDYTYTDATFADGSTPKRNGNVGWSVAESTAPDDAVRFMLREPTTLRQIIADACVAGQAWISVNAAGSVIWDSMSATPSSFGGHSDDEDIVDGSFAATGRPIWNSYKYQFKSDYVGGSGYLGAGELSDSTSIAAHGLQPAPELTMSWHRFDPGTVQQALAQALTRTKLQRWDADFLAAGTHGQGVSSDDRIGGLTVVTHREGIGGVVGIGDAIRALSPTHFWRFGEQPELSPATAIDNVAAGAANGTYAGSPQLGIVGPWDDGSTGLEADGVNDEITLASPIATTSTCSFVLLIRPEDFAPGGLPMWIVSMSASNAALRFVASGNNKMDMLFSAASHPNTNALTPRAWYLVGLSISAGAGTWYINGVADGTFSGYAGYSVNRLLNAPSSTLWAKGGFKDLALWIGTALTANQMASIWAHITSDRSAMGWQSRSMIARSMAWNLQDLATTYHVEERVA
jgi:hypothetical protein